MMECLLEHDQVACLWLGKNAMDTYQMLQEALKKNAFRDLNVESGTRPSRRVGSHVLDAQQPELLKTSSNKAPLTPQPPYNCDLAMCDFVSTSELKGKHCKSVGNIQSHITRFLKGAFQLSRGKIFSVSVLMQEETILKNFNRLYQLDE
ncbi:hypothetical protein J6590_007908 [Homalodisca vitripennis]|nr:hypothetical protein J6590_007908 [Homalodisca vitripennis]